jgi:hypothetical protein
MSNDVIIANLKNDLALIGGLDEDTRAIAGGNAGGNKRISIKGGVFRKIAGGKEIGTVEDRFMNIIFVKLAHKPSRTYYSGGYKEGEKVGPVCWSNNSETPDPEVKGPPASRCESCPMSVKGSGQGGNGTACRISWRTAVVLPSDPGGDVMQLVLPATSVFGKEDNGRWPFREYVKMLASHNLAAGRVVTKMQFDTKSPVPRLLFSPVSGINPADLETLTRQSKSAAAEAAVKLSVYQSDEAVVPPAVSAPAAEAAPVAKEPKAREVKKPVAAVAEDVEDVIKEWSSK